MQNEKQNPTMKGISYHIAENGKSPSYKYGKVHLGCYNTPPLREDPVLRSRTAPEGNRRGREEVKLSCFFNKRVKPKNLERLNHFEKRIQQR